MRLSCVRDNYHSANFPTQPYCYFFCFQWLIKASSFSTFPVLHETLHYSWQQNRIVNIGDIFQSVPL